jgi:hypothetical protein
MLVGTRALHHVTPLEQEVFEITALDSHLMDNYYPYSPGVTLLIENNNPFLSFPLLLYNSHKPTKPY